MAENKVSIELTVEEQAALKAITRVTKKFDELENDATRAIKKTDKEFDRFKTNVKAFVSANVIGAIGSNIVNSFGDAFDAAVGFESALVEINTILPKNTKLTEDQVEQLKALSSQYGTSQADQAKSFYQVISAGITDTTKATQALDSANKLAVGGLAGVGESIDVLTSILNGYGQENITAEEAADSLFKTVQLGKTTVSELAQSLALVVPSARSANVSLDVVNSAIATLTANGVDTARATTRLNALFAAFAQNGDKLGDSMNTSAVQTDGLITVLQRLDEKTGGNTDELIKLLGSQEAVQAAQILMRDSASQLGSTYEQFATKVGAADEAFKKIDQTTAQQIKRLKANTEAISSSIINAFLPALTSATSALNNFLNPPDMSQAQAVQEEINKQISALNELIDQRNSLQGISGSSDVFKDRLIELNKEIDTQREKLNKLKEVRRAINEPSQDTSRGPSGEEDDPALVALRKQQEAYEKQKEARDQKDLEDLRKQQEKYEKFKAAEDAENARRIQSEAELQAQLAQVRLDAKIAEEQTKLDQGNLDLEQRQASIEAIKVFEQQKAQAVLDQEKAKNQLLKTEQERKIANDLAIAKKSQSIQQAELDAKQRSAELEKQVLDTRLQAASTFLRAGLALAKNGSEAQKNIQTAQALVSTYTAANQALSSPPGPPFTLPLVAATIAQGLANVSRIRGQSFQNGGVVDGFQGATSGNDNRIVNARSGEMFLNASQQRELFEVANGNSQQRQDVSNEPMVVSVQVDGREIARAVRDQKRDGFRV